MFGQAAQLLEMALEEDPGLLRAAADKYDRLLDALAAEAEVGLGGTCVAACKLALVACAPHSHSCQCLRNNKG